MQGLVAQISIPTANVVVAFLPAREGMLTLKVCSKN